MQLLRALKTLAWLAAAIAVTPAQAQTTTTYSNTTTGVISDTTAPCTAPMTRNFTVAANARITDVNIGVQLTHSFRGDLRATLVSPAGTVVNLIANVGGPIMHLNVLFDDSAAASITTHTALADATTAAPHYQRNFRPQTPLAGFNGQNSAGTWRLTLCDTDAADFGNFTRADLYLTTAPLSADLSISNSLSNASPASGSSVSYVVQVTNAAGSSLAATGVTAAIYLPAGFSFASASGAGSFNAAAGQWAIGSVPPGTTLSLTINGTVTATQSQTLLFDSIILTSAVFDPDSIPGNFTAGEDDWATASLTTLTTRTAGTPPALVCPAGITTHDWDNVAWAPGTTSASYPVTAIGTMTVNIGITGGSFVNSAVYSGQSPTRQNVSTGGFSPAQYSMMGYADFTSPAGTSTSTIVLQTAVPGLQFRLFDIDQILGRTAERVTVTGRFNGTVVNPTLTNGVSNYISGNSALGDGMSDDGSANGNVVVTFAVPVDTIIIEFGSHSLAPANPDAQGMALHDISFCRPVANLTVAKTSRVVRDPTNGTVNPKAIPGATMLYCILVTNNGSAAATGINITDALPARTSFIPGSLRSGPSCAGAATVEDDNAAGTDESDPFGASVTGTTLSAVTATLGAAQAMAIAYNVTVN